MRNKQSKQQQNTKVDRKLKASLTCCKFLQCKIVVLITLFVRLYVRLYFCTFVHFYILQKSVNTYINFGPILDLSKSFLAHRQFGKCLQLCLWTRFDATNPFGRSSNIQTYIHKASNEALTPRTNHRIT